jgi:hypothetical protein
VLLRGVDAPTTVALAESLRATVADARLAGDGLPCTCSLGAVHVGRTKTTAEALLHVADGALYAAKRSGRDRVVFVELDDDAVPRGARPDPDADDGADHCADHCADHGADRGAVHGTAPDDVAPPSAPPPTPPPTEPR